jgi:predicted unusual protein kinase regulating ubiquinone biosynthesis (AarF/ABC1/UbiB family)
VTVKLIRPGFRRHFNEELHLLYLLKPAFTCDEWRGFNLDRAIAAFGRSIRLQIDLAQQADFCEVMALDAKDFDQLRVPALHRALCSSGMLTSERILGSLLTDVLDQTEQTPEPERSAMARQLWFVWSRQALMGSAFPVEPCAENVSLLPNSQVAFEAGSICPAAADSKKTLAQYLIAVLNEDPDRACFTLLQQATPGGSRAETVPLRNSFRQATSFRCSDRRLGNRTDGLAERLLVHWQLLHKHGFELSDQLTSFYRGLFLMNECCRKLAPAEDPLRIAVEQLRAAAVFEQFRDWLPLHDWKEDVGRYAGLMLELPKRLDDLLSVTADGTPALRIKIDEPVAGKGKSKLATLQSALCVGFAALTLFVPGVTQWLAVSLGAERVVLLIVWLLLMLVLRSGQ